MNQNLLHTPEGVRDIYGEEYAKKLKLEKLIHKKLKSFGYQDIQTPSFEFFDVFSREIGTTPSKELYKFFDKEGNTLVLRPDFTPSMARCAAKYFMEETFPIRFCYLGNTFTNISSLQGKLCEVTQMGAELIGDGSVEADAEMIAMLIECLKSAGLERFQVTVGEADYFRGLCEAAGLSKETELELRENVSGKNIFAVEDLLKEQHIEEEYREAFLKITELFGAAEVLEKAEALVSNARSLRAVERLKQVYELLRIYGAEQYISFDFGMLSKYHYYTGVTFRAYTYGVGDAIVKGGRYDNLLKTFGKDAPAVGFVVVLDDLMTAMASQKIILSAKEEHGILVYEKAAFERALLRAGELRKSGVCTELILKDDKKAKEEYQELAEKRGYFLEYFGADI
ncbi:MAG: ATP phosphoribosyltransferase regulatory subunit [Lachnospiraceae bacterium]|nr:ATP phosphoribosyltransferase regulatory subunit [Lachnospiraceae bacterium]